MRADSPELADDDIGFFLDYFFDVQLMSAEELKREKHRLAKEADPNPYYLESINRRLAGETLCIIPESVLNRLI